MKVLVIVNQLTEDQGALWSAAADLGVHEVVLAGARPRAGLDAYLPSSRPPQGMETVALSPVRLRPRADHLWWWYPGLSRVIGRHRPDLVHVHGELWGIPTQQALAAHPAVVAHGADNRFRFGSGLESRLRCAVVDRVVRRLRAYVSWNRAGADLVRARRPDLPVAVMPGVAVCDPGPPPRRPTRPPARIGFLGRLVPEKGVRLLLDALADLDRSRPNRGLELHLVGEGPELAVARAGYSFRVVAHGAADHATALQILSECDVLAVPSVDVPTWSEQYGRAAVEAMAHGVPLVVSDAGALPEVVGDGGLVVGQRDLAGWVTALDALLDDDARVRTEWSRRARRRFETAHTPAGHARDLVDLWSDVGG